MARQRGRLRRWLVILIAVVVSSSLAGASAGAASKAHAAAFNYCAHPRAVFKRRHPFVGISDGLIPTENSQQLSCTFGQMATRGFGYFRITIPWYGVEYSPGQYNWQGDDALLAAAAEHHIHVLMGILGAPRWDSTDPAADVNDNYPPADPSVFGQFAALAAQRYGPNGTFWRDNPTIPYYPVRSWEIWNEPNLADYWLPAPDATAYTQLLRASYVAIKQVDPHAIVVVAGMPFYGPADETAFITQMYKAGARNHFDAFALDEYAPTLAVAEQHLVLARRLMNRFHDRRKAIWILELGFAGGYPDAYISNQNKAAKTSAKFLVWLRKMRGALKLKEVFWYGWLDGGPPGGDPRYWAYNLGLFTSSMQPKPVLPVVTRAARLFDR